MDGDFSTTELPLFVEKVAAELALDEPHLRVFSTALTNVIGTEIAETTFAQIVDGLPLTDVAFSIRGHRDTIYDPVFKHRDLCPGVIAMTRAFREAFDPARLEVEVNTLQRYGSVPLGSRALRIPLLELVVVSVHEIATALFELQHMHHTDKSSEKDKPVDDLFEEMGLVMPPPFPTPFTLPCYADPEQYPRGVSALPGYWAEDRIFGGVALFRRDTESSPIANEVWFHSARESTTRLIYELTEDQRFNLHSFLIGGHVDSAAGACPLPILGGPQNRRRVDPEIAMPVHRIFRNRWERKVTVSDYSEYLRIRSDVRDPVDYPQVETHVFMGEPVTQQEVETGQQATSEEASDRQSISATVALPKERIIPETVPSMPQMAPGALTSSHQADGDETEQSSSLKRRLRMLDVGHEFALEWLKRRPKPRKPDPRADATRCAQGRKKKKILVVDDSTTMKAEYRRDLRRVVAELAEQVGRHGPAQMELRFTSDPEKAHKAQVGLAEREGLGLVRRVEEAFGNRHDTRQSSYDMERMLGTVLDEAIAPGSELATYVIVLTDDRWAQNMSPKGGIAKSLKDRVRALEAEESPNQSSVAIQFLHFGDNLEVSGHLADLDEMFGERDREEETFY